MSGSILLSDSIARLGGAANMASIICSVCETAIHDHFGCKCDYDMSDVEEDTTCRNCGGVGGEPYDDYCTPCEECDGEGYYWWL